MGGITSAAAASAHAGAAGVALGGAGTAKGALTVSSIALWLAAGAGLGTLVSAPALIVRLNDAPQPRATVQPALSAHAEPAPSAEHAQPAPLVQAAPAPEPVPPPARELAASRPAAPAPASSLAEETGMMERARRELAAGQASLALLSLEEHARRFPSAALGEEREALRVFALCALGRVEDAKRSAAAFVGASPRSPLIPRLRSSCAPEAAEPDYAKRRP
jgi:hypothetical protein